MSKTDYQITRQMQDDLIEAYKRVAPSSWTQIEAYRKTVAQPAPRYYVTPKQAAQVIAVMLRGDFSRVNLMMSVNRKRMYYSLFKKVMELSEKREFVGKSLRHICSFAVIQPAPEFFMNWGVVQKLRHKIRCGLIDDEGRTHVSPSKQRAYEKLKEKRDEERRSLLEYRRMRREMRELEREKQKEGESE